MGSIWAPSEEGRWPGIPGDFPPEVHNEARNPALRVAKRMEEDFARFRSAPRTVSGRIRNYENKLDDNRV